MRTPAPAEKAAPAVVVAGGLCIGCGGCVALSMDADATMRWDRHGELKPSGGDWLKRASAEFARTCPFGPSAPDEDALASVLFPEAPRTDRRIGRFESAHVGHVEEGSYRKQGSSGGMVSWTAVELLRRGLVDGVAHVVPAARPREEGRLFGYAISRDAASVRAGACSRYYPTELSGVLDAIRATPGRYAVAGVPCFIKAVRLLQAEDALLRERIVFTLGLFCGHMKSARFVDSLAVQMGLEAGEVTAVEYRVKDPSRPANWYRARIGTADGTQREQDWWHLVDGDWGAGFFQNSACNYCDDVVAETADIAFGDAWVEPYASDGRGANVVIVRNRQLDGIVSDAVAQGRLTMREVDADFVAGTQAAGLRHRREGLAHRLRWRRPALPLKKRVRGESDRCEPRRRLVYYLRLLIASWSHRVFAAARRGRQPKLYMAWAFAMLRLYQGVAYSRGVPGRICDIVTRGGPRP